jgi:DNA-binding transcriptional regulator GbsR (MarR family)
VTTPLGDAESTFIEHLSLLVHERGLPRSTGRVLGLMLICEPRHQSAEAIQQQLKLSVGSVSTALQLLQRLYLAQKRTFPEDRRFYYELAPDCWKNLIVSARRQMQWGVELANEGLAFSNGNDRLEGMRDLYKMSEELLGKIEM